MTVWGGCWRREGRSGRTCVCARATGGVGEAGGRAHLRFQRSCLALDVLQFAIACWWPGRAYYEMAALCSRSRIIHGRTTFTLRHDCARFYVDIIKVLCLLRKRNVTNKHETSARKSYAFLYGLLREIKGNPSRGSLCHESSHKDSRTVGIR